MFIIWSLFALMIYTVGAWIVNVIKLVFSVITLNGADLAHYAWGTLIIHAIGLIPFASWVTAWF